MYVERISIRGFDIQRTSDPFYTEREIPTYHMNLSNYYLCHFTIIFLV